MEGLPDLTVEQAFELTDASAERSAAAATVALSVESVAAYLRSNAALLRSLVADGYGDRDGAAAAHRGHGAAGWRSPSSSQADANASYAADLEIDLGAITEPLLACPNDPDDVRPLSEVQGTRIDDVFLGSCMTNIGHFRAAGEIWKGQARNGAVRTWLCPPTRMDQERLREEAYFSAFALIGARIEIPGCSLCMGNQARVPDGATVFSTSTRNFDDRMGKGAKVFLGSAELGAVAAGLGRLPVAGRVPGRLRRADRAPRGRAVPAAGVRRGGGVRHGQGPAPSRSSRTTAPGPGWTRASCASSGCGPGTGAPTAPPPPSTRSTSSTGPRWTPWRW